MMVVVGAASNKKQVSQKKILTSLGILNYRRAPKQLETFIICYLQQVGTDYKTTCSSKHVYHP
jgi:hypothetical protein